MNVCCLGGLIAENRCIRWLLKMDILVAAVPLAYELASVTRRVPPYILMQPKDICRKNTRTDPASAKNGCPHPHIFTGMGNACLR